MATPDLVVDCRNTLGEGATWCADSQRLYWVDIMQSQIWRLDPETGHTDTWSMPEWVGSIALRQAGGMVVALATGLALFDPDTGDIERIADVEADQPNTRLNDGRCDRQGRFVFGGIDEPDLRPLSGVYRLDPDRSVSKLINGVQCANSTCFTADGRTMFFADTPQKKIVAYRYDTDTGTAHDPSLLYDFETEPGIPDGSIADADGCVWNAEWQGRRVVRITPDGRIDRVIDVPVLSPTCVAFGGADLKTLYITTARHQIPPDQLDAEPQSGGLFAVQVDVGGLADTKFAG